MATLSGSGVGGGMNNLTTLIKRLEAATSRLEDIASSTGSFEPASGETPAKDELTSASAPELPSLAEHKDGREASTTTVKQVLPSRIEEMDELLETDVKEFVDASSGLDPIVEEQAQSVSKAFADQRRFLLTSTKAVKPDVQSPAFMDLLTDLQHHMGTVGDFRDSHRASPMKEHLAMVGEGITALQWLIMDGKPADFVGEVLGGAQMYGNRVLKAYKEGDQAHVKYVQAYYALLRSLQEYIKKFYPAGVTWNNTDGNPDAVQVYRDADSPTTNGVRPPPSSGPSSSSTGTAGPAPPPPPPPLPVFDNTPPSGGAAKAGTSDMGAIFEQLNRGESVTSGLKKVDKSQMTHKTPSLRAAGTVPDSSSNDVSRNRSPGPEVKPKPSSMRQNSSTSARSTPKKEPKKELDGNKWLVENFDSPSSPVELDVTLSQSILISKCNRTTIILKGKANAISIDDSPKTQILLESLVSSIDVIKCSDFAVQITGSAPTILLDQVDGASLYLGKESLATEVFTSKCSSVNVVLPPKSEEGDGKECPLPEQIRSFVRDGRLVSEIVEHAG